MSVKHGAYETMSPTIPPRKDHTADVTATLCELSLSKHCEGIATSTVTMTLSTDEVVTMHECDACLNELINRESQARLVNVRRR